MSIKLSIIIPVYNEVSTIKTVIDRVLNNKLDGVEKELIIVDDRSTDGTREILSPLDYPEIKVFFHSENRGKGAAIQTAQKAASGDVVIIQDADLEYSPEDYPRLLHPILSGKADAVYGSRFLGEEKRVLFFWHYVGNKTLTLISNMFTNLNLSDMETGYKAIRGPLFRSLSLRSKRFGFEPEITAKLAKARARIYEVPISYYGRDYTEGKKITWRDGVAALYHIVRFNLFDFSKHSAVSHKGRNENAE